MLNPFVALPDETKAALTGLVIGLVALIFDYAIGQFPWLEFLRRYQQELALATSTVLITWLENALPTGYEDVSIKGVAFVLALIGVFVPYLLIRKAAVARGVKAFR